jgi:hypothetical protein
MASNGTAVAVNDTCDTHIDMNTQVIEHDWACTDALLHQMYVKPKLVSVYWR